MNINFNEANLLVHNKKSAYNICKDVLKLFLLAYKSKAVTSKFLEGALSGKIFLIN